MTFLNEEQLNSLNKESMAMIIKTLQGQIMLLDTTNKKLSVQLEAANETTQKLLAQVEALTAQIRLSNQRHFGKSSEKAATIDGQMSLFDYYSELFNEAEVLKDDSKEPDIDEITISYKRKKKSGKREADLSDLPTRIFNHTLSEEELNEKFPEGYYELPAKVYKRLFIIPETFIVDEHHVHTYKSKGADGTIIKANRPADVFRNSIATPSLVAAILTSKYGNHVPLDRQARSFNDNGINIATNTLANWVINSSDTYLSLLYERMHKCIYDSKVLHVDETPCKVMHIDDKKDGAKTYMWVYRNRPLCGTPPIVLFDWEPGRTPDYPRDFLSGFSGTIVTDGYQVYHKIASERDDLKVAGCWIHARRKYAEIIKSLGDKASKDSIAKQAYDMITKIMYEDNKYDNLTKKDREKNRKLILKPMVNDYFAWVKKEYNLVAHESETGKAIAYSINQEPYLRAFLKNGDVPMDNNYAEQAIRPFTIGRKNYLFCESVNGAKASAIIYSIVETAKANGLNVYKYLEFLITELSERKKDGSLDHIDDLLPWAKTPQKECKVPIKKS